MQGKVCGLSNKLPSDAVWWQEDKYALQHQHSWKNFFSNTLKYQEWSPQGRPWPRVRPRGHILKSLALALVSKPQNLKNCPVLGSRTALFLEPLILCWKTPETSRKISEDLFCFPILETVWKNYWRPFFLRSPENFSWRPFWRTFAPVSLVLGRGLEHSCPWPREDLSSEGLSLAMASGLFLCTWPWPRALSPRLLLF